MKKARKFLLTLCAALLLVTMTVGVSIAYLTSTDKVKNTFTVGNVSIKLDEAKANLDGTLVEGADRVKENSYKLLPGHTYNKDPMVTVLAGSEDAYIRMIVTINEKTDLDNIGVNALEVFKGYDATKWALAFQKVGKNDTMVYEFRYYKTVNTLDNNDKSLEALFTKMIMPDDITNEQLATIDGLKIEIVAEAIQADGFNTADAAWAAFASK